MRREAAGDPMPVLGSDGVCIGLLDGLEGERIRLRRQRILGGSLPVSAIASVTAAGLRLNMTADRARELVAAGSGMG
jgi:hypothetical protein